MTDTGDMEDTLTDVGTPDETTEFEAGSDLPPSPFDSTLSTGESTLPVEPPPIPEPVAMTDTGDVEDTVTDVGALDEATEFEAGSDLLPLPFDSPFSTEESTLPVEPQPPIPEPVAMTDTGVAMTDTSDVEDTLTDVGAPDEATEFEAGSDLPPLPFDSPPSTEESTLPVEPPAPIPEETPAPPVHELAQAAGPPPFLSAASMVTEILAATPGETPAADALPAETEAPEPQALPGQNVVSPDFTIISNKRRRFHLR
jgi:hypothetical protein